MVCTILDSAIVYHLHYPDHFCLRFCPFAIHLPCARPLTTAPCTESLPRVIPEGDDHRRSVAKVPPPLNSSCPWTPLPGGTKERLGMGKTRVGGERPIGCREYQ